MTKIGYTLSSEEHKPKDLIKCAAMAEEVGFDFVSISDHFHPWTSEQGESPFVWTTLGGIAQATKNIEVLVGVTAPIIRIHPVIIAQATATAASLLENRFLFGVGTGENLNEHVTGEGWPPIEIRREMLIEAVDIIRTLWTGKNITLVGNYYTVEDAKIYTLPKNSPAIIVSAFGPISTKVAAEIGDGFITTNPDKKLVDLYKQNKGKGPIIGQFHVCYGDNEEACKELVCKIWPNSGLSGQLSTELRIAKYFEQAAHMINKNDATKNIPCGPKIEPILEMITKYQNAGFDYIYIHQIGPEQEKFLNFAKQNILSAIKK